MLSKSGFVALRYILIALQVISPLMFNEWFGQASGSHMAGVWTTLTNNVGHSATVFVFYMLSCWPETHEFPFGFWLFIFFPTGSCVGFKFLLDISASNKLFYRRSPVCLFCSYTVQAPQKWLPCGSWKNRGQKCRTNRLQKHVGGTARQSKGGERGTETFLTGRAKVKTFLVNSSATLRFF